MNFINAFCFFACVIFLVGCDQRTDFDACVEYWTKVANGKNLSKGDTEQIIIWYVEDNCKLSK
ncbi:hypothetical protein [Zobellella taiwanensis]|jgi:hypothetical protein